jgi:hyperosmotically inducible protein
MNSFVLGAGILAAAAGCGKTGSEQYTAARNEQSTNTWGAPSDIQTANTDLDQKQDASGRPAQTEIRRSNRSLNNQTREASKQLDDAPDHALVEQVKVAISTGSLGTTGVFSADQLTSIEVEANNGVVTLSGSVGSEKERDILIARVKGLQNVKEVVSRLTIDPSKAEPRKNGGTGQQRQ